MVKKFILKSSLFFVVINIGIGSGGFITADQQPRWVKYCDDPQCEKSTEVISWEEYKKKEEDDFYNLFTMIVTAAVPIIGLLWWIINIQQDKKNLEQNIKYDNDLDNKITKIITKQEMVVDDFNSRFEKLYVKLEEHVNMVSTYQLETIKSTYIQNNKIDKLVSLETKYNKLYEKISGIEDFLQIHHNYKIRQVKEDSEML